MSNTVKCYRYLSPRNIGAFFVSTTFGVLGLNALCAQSGAAPQNTAGGPKQKINVKADKYSAISATGIQTLAGNVRFTSDSTVMQTGSAQYNYNTSVAVAPGNIKIDDARNTLVGNSGKAYYKTHDAVIQGNVKIIVRPKPGSASAPEGSMRREFKDPVTIFCDKVVYNWRSHIAVGTGNLTLKQVTSDGTRRTATAKRLVYYTQDERLILEGDVDAMDSKGQKLKGPEATAITREGAEEFRMEKGAVAEILVEDEDESGSTKNAAPPVDPDTLPVKPSGTPKPSPATTPPPPATPVATP